MKILACRLAKKLRFIVILSVLLSNGDSQTNCSRESAGD